MSDNTQNITIDSLIDPANDIRTDFIDVYARSVLEDLGVKPGEDEQSEKLVAMAKNRITARLYLEMIGMLTPEQAALVVDDQDSAKPDPERAVRKTIETIPDFAPRIAMVLGKIRSELMEDLKPLVSK